MSGDGFRQLEWPNAGSKPDKRPIYARLKNGGVKIEKDEFLEGRIEFLYKYVVFHLFH